LVALIEREKRWLIALSGEFEKVGVRTQFWLSYRINAEAGKVPKLSRDTIDGCHH
jgi:hypothetical protein